MPCPIRQRKFSEFSTTLESATVKRRIPYMGVLDLTYRCNQSCCHCYCNLSLNDKRKDEELKSDEIKRILDEVYEAGCLWFLFTGGEVLLRKDFLALYLYAVKKGMLIDVFTNGTLITEEVAKAFAEFPPLGLDITIYGADPSIHDRITRVKGSFEKTMEGIRTLMKYKVPYSLKTVVLTLNYDDLKNMRRLAKDLDAKFRFDPLVCPRIDGNDSPLKYRLPMEKIVDLEIYDEESAKSYKDMFDVYWKRQSEDMFVCGAGINSFNINPYGFLSPCSMYMSFQYSLREMSFKDAWNKLISDYGKVVNEFISYKCRMCSMVWLCPSCPAWAELEAKRLDKRVDFLCEYVLLLEKRFLEKIKEVEDAEKTLSEARA